MDKTSRKKKSYYVPVDKHESPDRRQRLGVKGEDTACAYLEKKGMRIIGRNVRYSMGEIDIVARMENRLVFVEVKTRETLKYGRPSLALTEKKQKTIRQLAQCYMHEHREYRALSPRIDVIELIYQNGEAFVNHIESAF